MHEKNKDMKETGKETNRQTDRDRDGHKQLKGMHRTTNRHTITQTLVDASVVEVNNGETVELAITPQAFGLSLDAKASHASQLSETITNPVLSFARMQRESSSTRERESQIHSQTRRMLQMEDSDIRRF